MDRSLPRGFPFPHARSTSRRASEDAAADTAPFCAAASLVRYFGSGPPQPAPDANERMGTFRTVPKSVPKSHFLASLHSSIFQITTWFYAAIALGHAPAIP